MYWCEWAIESPSVAETSAVGKFPDHKHRVSQVPHQWVAKRTRGQLGLAFLPDAMCAGQRLATGYVSAAPTPCSAWQRQLARWSERAVDSVKVTLLPLSHFDLSRYLIQPLSLKTLGKTAQYTQNSTELVQHRCLLP